MLKRVSAAAVFLLVVQAGVGSADYVIVVANIGQSKAGGGGVGGAGPGAGFPGPGQPGPGQPGSGFPGPGQPGSGQPGSGFPGPGGPGDPNNPFEEVATNILSVVVDAEPYPVMSPHFLKNYTDGKAVLYAKTRWGVAPMVSREVMAQKNEVHAIAEMPTTGDPKTLPKMYPSVAKLYAARVAATNAKKDASTEDFLDDADWALAYGMPDRAVDVVNKLTGSETHKAHPAVAAFAKVNTALAEKVFAEPAGQVVAKLKESGKYKVETGKFYQVYHNLTGSDAAEARSRLARLESAYKTVYFWYALRGVELPIPNEKLIAILTSSDDDHKQLHQLLGKAPLVVDSFHARRENVAVFALRRTDRNYDAVEKYATTTYYTDGKVGRADLAKWKEGREPQSFQDQQALAFALMLKAMEVQGEVASSTHQAARQVMFTTGLLPRNVHVPEWAQFGFASFFETPLDAPYGSAGKVSSLHFPAFRELQKAPSEKEKAVVERLEEKLTSATLKGVVTDAYFRQASLISDSKSRYPYQVKARSTAWALMYYLMRNQRDGLARYWKELAKLPRDMQLDEEQLWVCFAKAFEAFDAKTGTVNTAKLNDLARRWDEDLKRARLESKELLDKVADARKEVDKIAKGEVGPMNPGGMGPGGPGGPGFPGGGPGGRP